MIYATGRVLVIGLSLVGCGELAMPTDAPADAGPPAPFVATHTFPAIELEAGGEVQNLCQSWTLNNAEPLLVNGVVMDAEDGWHHSNWMFVSEDEFEGPDGTWPCSERAFNEINAAVAGGAVFFAQSTQSTHEEMRFPEGAAYRIPARSRVIGSVHLINYTESPSRSALTFTIEPIAESALTTRLYPLAMDNRGIRIGPRASSATTTECDFARVSTGDAIDWSIYYVLPHYHALATEFRLEVLGGPRDGEVVFETSLDVGDPLGAAMAPPFDLSGATGLRMRCAYQNTGPDTVSYGPSASDEMCVMLAYTTSGRSLAGSASMETSSETLPDGSLEIQSSCFSIGMTSDE